MLTGLHDVWGDESEPSEDSDAWLTSFTIITTTATDDVGRPSPHADGRRREIGRRGSIPASTTSTPTAL
jgi:hypothetical protein